MVAQVIVQQRPDLVRRVILAGTALDAAHRAETGRPISRDNLRARLRIGRDRASALVAAVRAEATARAAPRQVSQAA
jgi:pimeloyl-ACP methyl ester carboxylesterase